MSFLVKISTLGELRAADYFVAEVVKSEGMKVRCGVVVCSPSGWKNKSSRHTSAPECAEAYRRDCDSLFGSVFGAGWNDPGRNIAHEEVIAAGSVAELATKVVGLFSGYSMANYRLITDMAAAMVAEGLESDDPEDGIDSSPGYDDNGEPMTITIEQPVEQDFDEDMAERLLQEMATQAEVDIERLIELESHERLAQTGERNWGIF
jgi:hypothetical protein